MKRVNQLFVPFLILCTIGLSQMQAQKVQFFTSSLAQLENQVKQSRTPYFLYFSVLDCDACTKMHKEAFSYPPLATYAANSYLALQVDGLDFSEGIDIATRYIANIPALIDRTLVNNNKSGGLCNLIQLYIVHILLSSPTTAVQMNHQGKICTACIVAG